MGIPPLSRRLEERFDEQFDERFDERCDERFDQKLDERFDDRFGERREEGLDAVPPARGRTPAEDLAASLDTIRITYLEVAGTSRRQRRLARRMAELAALLQSAPEDTELASLVMEADLLLGDVHTSLRRGGRVP